MKICFSKYQGTGNDFIMLNNMDGVYNDLNIDQIRFLCDRRFGIGGDGLIKISRHEDCDFVVEYYNADGSQSFCGNGARCSVAFAMQSNIIGEKTHFMAIDGPHNAMIRGEYVHLEMLPVALIEQKNSDYIINTGSPHYIRFVDQVQQLNIVEFGQSIRYSPAYKDEGINVNIVVEIDDSSIEIATYERGVEAETLSCGTGATACALAFMDKNEICEAEVSVHTKGGRLTIKATRNEGCFNSIQLAGPAKKIFDGSIEI
ncbi:diaminopimelate epimerase [Crocinitomicaceae bacterium]|nr:diaminopimelate epimerase [Crocinitomicaceae bacterium]